MRSPMRTGLLIAAAMLSTPACGNGAARPAVPDQPAPPADAAPAESDWYREQVEHHGRDNVLIGSVPFTPGRMWMSTRTEDAASAPEYIPFGEGLHARLEEEIYPRLQGTDPPFAPWIGGEVRDARELWLSFDPSYMSEHLDVLVDTLALIQDYLSTGTNRLYRIIESNGSLVIYPDAIFLGEERFDTASQLADRLPAWLATMTFEPPAD